MKLNYYMKLGDYVKGLIKNSSGGVMIDVNKIRDNGFSDQVYMGEAKFAFWDETFLKYQDHEILTVVGGAGECLSVSI